MLFQGPCLSSILTPVPASFIHLCKGDRLTAFLFLDILTWPSDIGADLKASGELRHLRPLKWSWRTPAETDTAAEKSLQSLLQFGFTGNSQVYDLLGSCAWPVERLDGDIGVYIFIYP